MHTLNSPTRAARRRRGFPLLAVLAAASVMMTLAACEGTGGGAVGGTPSFDGSVANATTLGATAGGAQDMEMARTAIERGSVPESAAILTEGLFSEHDLTLEGEPSDRLLSLNLGTGMLRDAEGAPHYLVQVGMTSNLDAASFRRPPLNLCIVVDVSGSMRGQRMAATRRAIAHVIRQLDGDDIVSMVAFHHDAWEMIRPTRAVPASHGSLLSTVDTLEAGGLTDMGAGMRLGYDVLARSLNARAAGGQPRNSRMLLITDALPNQGRIEVNDFLALVERNADRDIGLTTFGVGIDFGISLVTSMTTIRGANYRYIARPEDLQPMIEDEFQFLVTPLAHDFSLRIEPASGYRVRAMHGVPGWREGRTHGEVRVATMFVSRRGGAIAIELEPDGSALPPARNGWRAVANVSLGYTEVTGRQRQEQGTALMAADAEQGQAYFSHQGVARTAILAFTAEGMRRACRDFHTGNSQRALLHLDGLPELLRRVARETNSPKLNDEARLVEQLRANITARGGVRPVYHPEPTRPAMRPAPTRPREPDPVPAPPSGQPVRW